MKIALVGGTGDIGTGFAVRWAEKHEIIIGSRNADKALDSAAQVMKMLEGKGNVRGEDKTQPWEVDAISGATVTSRAIGRAMNDSAQKNLPLLAPHFGELRRMP